MPRLTLSESREIARDVSPGETVDFHRLSSSQVEKLLRHADARKYRTPRNANGSRARCFWQYVCRSF